METQSSFPLRRKPPMETQSSMPLLSLRPIAPVPANTPVHFRIPMGRDPEILLSVDGSGNFLWSLTDDPCERRATTEGCIPDRVTSFGKGPLIFLEVDVDGKYFTRPPLPGGGRSFRSMQQIINAACAVLLRPSPVPDLPQCGNEFVSSLKNPPRLDIIAACLSSPCIFTWRRWDWGITFYIRVDLGGSYHTYPHVGGPFRTLDEAYSAIECDLQNRQDAKMFMRQPEDSQVDYVVRQCLCWPDGTRKRRLKSEPIDKRRDEKCQLAQALVDKYSDYLGDLAYELKDVVHYESVRVRASYKMTYHINFTAKTKGTEDSDCGMDDLFFAEVTCMTGDNKLVVSCFCRVKPTDNGFCYGCNAKHPNVAVYSPGQSGACFPFGGPDIECQVYDEDLEAEEARVRRFYEKQGLDDPRHEEKLRALMAPFRMEEN